KLTILGGLVPNDDESPFAWGRYSAFYFGEGGETPTRPEPGDGRTLWDHGKLSISIYKDSLQNVHSFHQGTHEVNPISCLPYPNGGTIMRYLQNLLRMLYGQMTSFQS